jgi:hypothetical protein
MVSKVEAARIAGRLSAADLVMYAEARAARKNATALERSRPMPQVR